MPARRFLALALTLPGLLGTSEAQRRKLSGPMKTAYLSDVTDFDLASGRILYRESGAQLLTLPLNGGTAPQVLLEHGAGARTELTPDGARVLLLGSLESAADELFSMPADGSGPLVKLNAPLTEGTHVTSYAVSPDGQFVVYTMGQFGLGLPFSVRADGSQPAVPIAGRSINRFEITSDSSRVLFQDWGDRLYTAPITGGTPLVLVQAQPPRAVAEFALAPDGSRVVYRCDATQISVQELWSAPVDASQPPVKLNGPLAAGGQVWRFHVSPHSQHVTYVAAQQGDAANALYAVSITGGAAFRLSAGVAGRDIVEAHSSPDRSRMLYLANHDDASSLDLYSVPIDGSQPAANLTATLATAAQGFLFDAVSERVVFRIHTPGGTFQLFSAALDGSSAPVRLDPPGASEGVQADFAIAAGSRVVFLTDASTPERHELHSAPVDGSAPALRLHPALPPDGRVYSFVLDAPRAQALYRAEQDIDDVIELFLVPVDGDAPPVVRSTIREHPSTVGDVGAMALTPDGTSAIYTANQASGRGVFVVRLDGDPQPVLLGGEFAQRVWVTPDSQRVLYTDSDGLQSMLLDASVPATLIAGFTAIDGIAADSSRVVFRRNVSNYEPSARLLSVPVTGAAPAIELNLPRAVNGQVWPPQISPDSARVVYAGIQDAAGVIELYSVPLAGGAAPVELSGQMVLGGSVVADEWSGPPQISADSSRVVYRADQDVDDCLELYSVPLAGGAAPVQLSVLPGADRDVTSFAISPDSTRVVYVADQDANDVHELYSVPLAGGATPVELSALPNGDRDVDEDSYHSFAGEPRPFLISPDSDWVVYRADQDVDDAFDLYAVPLTGGTAPLRLTFDAMPGAVHGLLAISPDSRTVVFARWTSTWMDLYAVPLHGGAAPRRLNGSLPVTQRFPNPDAEIDSTGRWVLFHAAPDHPDAVELFVAPLHGLGAPLRVNAPLAGDGPVIGTFRPGSSAVPYIADQDEAGVFELYVNEVVGTRSHGALPR